MDLASVQLRGKSFTDKEELLPLCYRCSTVNPLVNSRGSRCTNCSQPFVFSFVSFGERRHGRPVCVRGEGGYRVRGVR